MSRGSRMKRAGRLAVAKAAKVPDAHWQADEWRKNFDDLVVDGTHPQAFPSTYPMDLLGQIRVKLTAEDGDLVAYGFGGQRIAMPHKSIGSVLTLNEFRLGASDHPLENALLVLDRDKKILLRADGAWDTYGEVARVCKAAKLPSPKHTATSGLVEHQPRGSTHELHDPGIPRYLKAPGYRRLRVHPRGQLLRGLAVLLVYLVTLGVGVVPGALLMALLPESFGAVRILLALVVIVLGGAGGIWAGAAILHAWTDALRWAGASWLAKAPAPPNRFFSRRQERSSAWQSAADIGLAALFVALVAWGPGVGIAALAHGFQQTANLISGALCTLALPPLGLYLLYRWRRRRWQPAGDFANDLTA